MRQKVSFEDAVYFTKLSVYLAWTWPPSRSATKWEIRKCNIAWTLSFLNVSCLVFPLMAGIYVHSSNALAVTQSTCFICAGLNYFIKTLLYRTRRKRMQIMMCEMEDFFENARTHEKNVLQAYIDGRWRFHLFITTMNYLTAIAMAVGPLVFHQPLDNFAVYPFPVDTDNARYMVWIHQVFAFFQFSAAITSDCHVAMIMWFAIARLEILADEVRNLSSATEFGCFIEKHQRLLAYAFEVADTMCYGSFATTVMSGMATIMSCMRLVSNPPLPVKVQYGPLVLICIANLFVFAWPAENLLRVCDLLSTAVYNTSWPDMSNHLKKDVLIVLRRSQKPITVSIGGFIPILSLRFYATFLSAAYSYFTALRVAATKDWEY